MFKIAIVKYDTLIAMEGTNLPFVWDVLYDAYREEDVIVVEPNEYNPNLADDLSLVEDALREYINGYCDQFGDLENDELISITYKLTEDGVIFGILLDDLTKAKE